MAFEIKLGKKEVTNPEANRIYLTDVTGNVGEVTYTKNEDDSYTSVTNSTGYGAPNPLRANLANIIVGRLKGTKGDSYIEFIPYNPITTSEYIGKIAEDGWYVFNIISLPIVSSIVEGEAWYNTSTGKVNQVKNGLVVEIEAKDLLATLYNVEEVQHFFIGNSKLLKNKYIIKITDLHKSNVNCCNDKLIVRLQDTYNELRVILQSSIYEYCRGNKFNAQENIEFITNSIDDVL